MARQLALLEPRSTDWKLDEATRLAGRRGIAAARAALAAVAHQADDDDRHLPAA